MTADTGERFNFAFKLHAKLARGGSTFIYECEDFGISRTDFRKTSRDPWRRTYRAEDLPGWDYDNLPELIADLRAQHPGEYEGFAQVDKP